MSYKKCKNDNHWCECKKRHCKPEREVVYYECKGSKPGNHNCCKCIRETHNLIDAVECKNDKLADDLETAQENQVQAVAGIEDLKDDLADIGTALGKIQEDLNDAMEALKDAIDRVNDDIAPHQENAAEAINDAITKQEQIDDIIECLESSFRATVRCLKESCSGGGCPILVPRECCDCKHNCKHNCKHDCKHDWYDECDYCDECDCHDKCDCDDDCDDIW